MPGLPSDLYQRCRTTLLKCSEFDSDAALRFVFVAEELRPFRDRLLAAASKSERVDTCLAFLAERRLSDNRPVLPLFLAALRDRYQKGDALQDELGELIESVQSRPVLARQVCQVPQAVIDEYGENIALLPNASMDALRISDGAVVRIENRSTGQTRFAFAYATDRVCDASLPQVLRSRLGVTLSPANDLEITRVAPCDHVTAHEVCQVPRDALNRYGPNVIVLSKAIAQILNARDGEVIRLINQHNGQEKSVSVCSMNRVCEMGIPQVLRLALGVRPGQDNEIELRKV